MVVKALLEKCDDIKTNYVFPPIADRNFDWEATFEYYEPGDLIGYGSTESAAINDLVEKYLDSLEVL